MNRFPALIVMLSIPFAAMSALPDSVVSREGALKRQQADITRWMISAKTGFSYRVADLPPGLSAFEKEYYSDLKSGYFYDFSSAWYFKSGFGITAFYEAFKSRNELNNVTVIFSNGFQGTGTVSDDITISQYGAGIAYRKFSRNHNGLLNMSFGFGKMDYINHAKVIESFDYSGNTLGGRFTASYSISLSREFWLGLHLGWSSGILEEVEIDNGINKQKFDISANPEGLQHVNIGLKGSFTF